MAATVQDILERAAGGGRISQAEGVLLLEQGELNALGRGALAVRRRLHPETIATYVVDRNINYTNVCVADCEFCAFYRRPRDPEAYVLSQAELFGKIRELRAIGGTQVLLQGGHHPYLKLEWYEEMIRGIRRDFPDIHVHAFSPSEIVYFAKLFKLPVREIIRRLKDAGLHSIPGGGGEILVDRVRRMIAPQKAMTDEWLGVMADAAKEGLRGSATMVIGHCETLAERVEHLERLRRAQDEHQPFTAFVVWTMQPRHTRLEGKVQPAGAFDYLRTLAVARMYLDNIRNVQASWVTQGAKVGQLSFLYGCNDWGGLMMEENVVSEAGTRHEVQVEELRRLSSELGLTLRKRDYFYRLVG
ncbi:MAG: dehypoxanthine futalosine cyclase [Planctomycetota bacterium]|nr:dehypoxanthine futalosine cyclase [Planctomycetota bacterium]